MKEKYDVEGHMLPVTCGQGRQVNKWTAAIVERCLTQLVRQGKPYKYIMKYAVMQKTGACIHTANSCYWDTAMDESCTVRWENRSMYFVVNVFTVAIAQETHTYKCTYSPPLPEEEEE
uniref:Dynein light chain Tctex-type 3 n=1 Tax=Monopterus albus TaxID=43700 RepID=A0A3Q3JV32_MONAL